MSLAPIKMTVFLPSSAADSPIALDKKTSENHRKQIPILGGILFSFLGFSGDLSAEACGDIGILPIRFAKSEAAIQDSLGRSPRNNNKKEDLVLKARD